MQYTLHQLKVFLKVSQNQSITKAAEELHLTQHAVSIQLKNFQDQFEVPLTEVVGRQLYVTDFGKEIAIAAEKILNEVDAINYRTLTYKKELAGKLKFSVASTGKYVMPYLLTKFMAKNKGVDLIMDVTNKNTVITHLEKNEVDFALVSVIPEQLKTNSIALLENKLYLVGSTTIKTAKGKPLSKIFEEKPLIYREEGSATRIAMEQFILKKKLSRYKKMELTSNEALKQAILAGLGYSIIPLIGIKNELITGQLEIIPISGLPIITNWNLIWLKSKKLSPVASAFLEHLKSEKQEIMQENFSWYYNY